MLRFCLSVSLSPVCLRLSLTDWISFPFVVSLCVYLFLITPPPALLSCSVPNLNSDLFDLQPAFIPAVQSTPSISTANSAWGGTLPAHIHISHACTNIMHLYIRRQQQVHGDVKRTPAFTHTHMNLFLKYSLWPVIRPSAHPSDHLSFYESHPSHTIAPSLFYTL